MSTSYTPTIKTLTPAHYRPVTYVPPPQAPRPNITDDYERWYTEASPNNRMLLSLRSGIHSEIGWALDRLCRLCDNEQFLLRAIPGLTDALFEWPEWYASQKDTEVENLPPLFAPIRVSDRERRHALESLFILRNAALNEPNAVELASHPRTQPMVLKTLQNRRASLDTNVEFILHAIELLHAVASNVVLPPLTALQPNPTPYLQDICGQSSNRTLIIASLTTLTAIFSNASNVTYLVPASPALTASIRYLPLFTDKPLLEACLNYLYVHLSQPTMAKAFLLHPDMQATLQLLVTLLLAEQGEETVSIDVGGEVVTVPSLSVATKDHELSQEEFNDLLEKAEPQRCYEWMRSMFVAKADGEMTQVEFWKLYKDSFSPFSERLPLLVASDVIKNVNVVFPQAQAMVLPGPPQKFVVRGVQRLKVPMADERFKCHWDRSQCPAGTFDSPMALYEHLQNHISDKEGTHLHCLWMSCSRHSSRHLLRAHVLTHLPVSQPPAKPPSQSDTITLPSKEHPYPTSNPTHRPPPPPRSTTVTFQRPAIDPPSSSLTALLCIRILFRTSFASTDVAPRADAEHFGFPGLLDDADDPEPDDAGVGLSSIEREGEQRGRRAFVVVRSLLEAVRMRDEVLMGWITEMVEAGFSGRS